MAAKAAASGLLPETVAVAPSTVLSIVGGLTQDQMPEFGETPKTASPKRPRMARSSAEDAPTSIKHRSQSASNAERPRPTFDQAWAVKDLEDENEAGVGFHFVGITNNHTKSKEGKVLLDDWDAMLKGSCFSRCNNLMNFVKAFFLTKVSLHRAPLFTSTAS